MAGQTVESQVQTALTVGKTDNSAGTQLVTIAQRIRLHNGSLNELDLGSTIDILLDEFVRAEQSDMIRRWIGVVLLAVAEKESLHFASTSQSRQHALGDVIFSRTTEDIRLLAGAIIRSVAADGISIDTFWSPGAETALTNKFPRLGESQWVEQFEESLEVLALDTLSDADIYWAVYATIDRDTIRPRGGRVVLFAEHNCLKLITPPTPGPPQFLDLLFEHITSSQVALLPVTGNGRSSNHPVLDIVLDDKTLLNVTIDARPRHANQVKVWFKDVESAKEISSIISQSQSSSNVANIVPPSNMPISMAPPMKVAKSSRPVKCSQDNSSSPVPTVAANKTPLQASRSNQGKARPPKIVSRLKDEHGRSSPLNLLPGRSKSKSQRARVSRGAETKASTLFVKSLVSPNSGSSPSNRKSDTQAQSESRTRTRSSQTTSRTLNYGLKSPLRSNDKIENMPETKAVTKPSTSGSSLHFTAPNQYHALDVQSPLEDQENRPIEIDQDSPSPAPSPLARRSAMRTPMTRAKTKRVHAREILPKPAKKETAFLAAELSSSVLSAESSPFRKSSIHKPSIKQLSQPGLRNEEKHYKKTPGTSTGSEGGESAGKKTDLCAGAVPAQKRCGSPEDNSPSKRTRWEEQDKEILPIAAHILTGSQLLDQINGNGNPHPQHEICSADTDVTVKVSRKVVHNESATPMEMDQSTKDQQVQTSCSYNPIHVQSTLTATKHVKVVDLEASPVRNNVFEDEASSNLGHVERASAAGTVYPEAKVKTGPAITVSQPALGISMEHGAIRVEEPRVIPFRERLRSRLPRPKPITANTTKDWDENEDTLIEDDHEIPASSMNGTSAKAKRSASTMPKWFQAPHEQISCESSDDEDCNAPARVAKEDIEDEQQSSNEQDEELHEGHLHGHHLELHKQLCLISSRLIGLVAGQEAAVNQTISRYQENSAHIIAQLVYSHAEEAVAKVNMLSTSKAALTKLLDDCEQTVVADHSASKHLAKELAARKSRPQRISVHSFEKLLDMCP